MKIVTWLGATLIGAGLILMLVFTSPLGLGLLLLGAPLSFFGATTRALRRQLGEQQD